MSDDLKNIVEAVLLASDGPVGVSRIQALFDEATRPEASRVHEAIEGLMAEYQDRGVELRKIGSGYRFQTRDKYSDYLRKLYATRPPKLSRALLETLAISAYRQPVSRGDIEEIRGVGVSTDIMQRLVERGWIKQVGVRDVPGRPELFGTTAEFLSYFNLTSLRDLPDLAEQRDLMDIAGEMETPLPAEVLAALKTGHDQPDVAQDDSADGTSAEQGVSESEHAVQIAQDDGEEPAAEEEIAVKLSSA